MKVPFELNAVRFYGRETRPSSALQKSSPPVSPAALPGREWEGAAERSHANGASAGHLTDTHFFTTEHGEHALIVDASRVYDVDPDFRRKLEAAAATGGTPAERALLATAGLTGRPAVESQAPAPPPVRALSLAVSQHCNLACGYCYAGGGGFGGAGRQMSWPVARASVERLLESAQPGERVSLAFLGGEPLLNRDVLRRATEHAAALGRSKQVQVGFAVTTNGTALRAGDAEFFARHGFAVTVSIDGPRAAHDRLRPTRNGNGSYDRVLANLHPLLARRGRLHVSARVTVTPRNLALTETLDHLIGLGFRSVGFAPALSAANPDLELHGAGLRSMLAQMTACGRRFEREVIAGRPYPFSNMMSAMQELHRGRHRPYPCGAGAGYLGVSAEGELFACHRFVGDERAAMGDIAAGIDTRRRTEWLTERHVHRQEPCRSCWARYLCGGGCHHEVLNRGRPACDYIRGWLHYCLQAYVRLNEARPDYFD